MRGLLPNGHYPKSTYCRLDSSLLHRGVSVMKSIICLSCAVAFFQVQTAIAQGTCQQNYVAAIKNCGLEPGMDPKTYSQSQRDCIKSAQAVRKTCIASATPLITTPPLSSDVAVKLPAPPPPMPDNSWSGFYAGVNWGLWLGQRLRRRTCRL